MGEHRKSARFACDATGFPLTLPTFDLLDLDASDIFDDENVVMAGSAARWHASRRGVTQSRSETVRWTSKLKTATPLATP
jgi:hypothetical protein